ncbi:hypothetical protein DFS34DRAFT_633833 [Phlyctochytrium arcticum]|nr:hypothetical protein DFS34DRAFT_633833 [Phlyctochytrium arcticum]
MSFNSNRYGVLSTYDETYFFQRVCSQGGGHLKVAGPFSHRSTQPFTVLEAYITILFLSRDHWFYGSPYSSPYSSQPGSPSSSRARLVRPADPYTVSDVDFEAIRFGKGCDRSNVGVIVRGTYFGRAAVFKIVDETKHVEHIESLNKEVDVYQHLASQQGQTIPKLLGFIRLWGMLRMLVLEDYGQSVEDAIKSPSAAVEDLKHECLQALDALHSQGFAHGDARIANFVVSVTGGVRILDFGEVKDATPEWTDLDRQKMLEGFDASTPNSVISVANTNSEHKS